MMFVDHAVEAELVRQHVLVEAHIIEISAFFWIVHAARQVQPRRSELVVRRQMRPGEFGEMIKVHQRAPLVSSRKSINAAANRSDCSICGKWPAFGIETNRPSGRAFANARP